MVPKTSRMAAGLFVLVGAATGCAHVNQEDLGIELAQIREEIREGDQATNARVDQVESRLDGVESRIDMLEQDLSALENEFEVTVERLSMAARFNTPIFFAFDDATIRDADKPLLERFTSVVQEHYPGSLITVEGFTDQAGSREYNIRLGLERAQAVREYLVNAGLAGEAVRAVSYGEDTNRLITPGAIRDEGMRNRRVVMVVDFTNADPNATGVIAAAGSR